MLNKKSYKKARIYLSWRYPDFYRALCIAKFPLQLGAVCVALAYTVSFYNAHYSFAASIRAAERTTANTTTTAADTLVAGNDSKTENPVVLGKQTDNDKNVVRTQSSSAPSPEELAAPLEDPLPKSEDATQEPVLKTKLPAKSKEQQKPALDARKESAGKLLRKSDSLADAIPTKDVEIKLQTAYWLQQQPENHFVAQVAAAVDKQILLDYAISKEFKPPLAIYPFKTNKKGELVFGLSSGLFITKSDAMAEVPELRKISKEHGVWVREVADIKKQLATLKDLALAVTSSENPQREQGKPQSSTSTN